MKTKILLALLFGTTFSGCASFYDCYDENTMSVRNHVLAKQAWMRWQWCYADMPCHGDFGRGFRDGYIDGINGVPNCQPVLPPRRYWSVKYQSADGHCHVNAWYNGYSHGHLAALKDGYGEVSRIPMSPSARQNMLQAQASAELRKSYQARKRAEGSTIRAPYFGSGSGVRTQRTNPDGTLSDDEEDPDLGIDGENLKDALEGALDGEGAEGTRPYEDTPPGDSAAATRSLRTSQRVYPMRQANVPMETEYLPPINNPN